MKIVIRGGGWEAWVAASYLHAVLEDSQIALIEKPVEQPAALVTDSGFSALMSAIGWHEKQWMPACNASYHYGTLVPDGFLPLENLALAAPDGSLGDYWQRQFFLLGMQRTRAQMAAEGYLTSVWCLHNRLPLWACENLDATLFPLREETWQTTIITLPRAHHLRPEKLCAFLQKQCTFQRVTREEADLFIDCSSRLPIQSKTIAYTDRDQQLHPYTTSVYVGGASPEMGLIREGGIAKVLFPTSEAEPGRRRSPHEWGRTPEHIGSKVNIPLTDAIEEMVFAPASTPTAAPWVGNRIRLDTQTLTKGLRRLTEALAPGHFNGASIALYNRQMASPVKPRNLSEEQRRRPFNPHAAQAGERQLQRLLRLREQLLPLLPLHAHYLDGRA